MTPASATTEGRIYQVWRQPHAVRLMWSVYNVGTNPKYAADIPQNAVPLTIRQELLSAIGAAK